jgi:hypothetical protein
VGDGNSSAKKRRVFNIVDSVSRHQRKNPHHRRGSLTAMTPYAAS